MSATYHVNLRILERWFMFSFLTVALSQFSIPLWMFIGPLQCLCKSTQSKIKTHHGGVCSVCERLKEGSGCMFTGYLTNKPVRFGIQNWFQASVKPFHHAVRLGAIRSSTNLFVTQELQELEKQIRFKLTASLLLKLEIQLDMNFFNVM